VNILDIIARLKNHISKITGASVTDKEVAEAIGMTNINLYQLKRRSSIPYEKIIAYCNNECLSLDHVFLGKELENKTDSDEYLVKFFDDVYGSCGGGSENEQSSERYIKLDKVIIDTIRPTGININIEAIRAVGDSMEPKIKDGAITLVDRNDVNIQKMGIFAVKTDEGLMIKRLHKSSASSVDIISENTIYPSRTVELGNIDVLGRIIGLVEKI